MATAGGMKDTEFYEQVLGITEPWKVEEVKLDVVGRSVEVRIGYRKGTLWACAESRERMPCHDHVERRWRHLDTCGFTTVLHCRVPRVRTPEGKVETVPVPWAAKGSRFTLFFERFAIEVLLAARSVSAAAELLDLSWDQLQLIMERAVERGLERRRLEGLWIVGMDEKSFGKGQDYISLLNDLDGSRVVEVMPGNDLEAAQALLESLPEEVRTGIDAVCIDMSGHFAAAVERGVPEAAIVHDRYHISAHLNDAVAKVHREENKRLQKLGDERLKGTQRLFGFDPDHLDEEQALRFAELKDSDLKSARAWAIKEMFRRFWGYRSEGHARRFFRQWFGWASRSRLKSIIKVARMIKAHFENIITYLRYPITNAVTEGLNSKIQSIKANARGFRSFVNYRTRILFFCGKLDLYPL